MKFSTGTLTSKMSQYNRKKRRTFKKTHLNLIPRIRINFPLVGITVNELLSYSSHTEIR